MLCNSYDFRSHEVDWTTNFPADAAQLVSPLSYGRPKYFIAVG
jgi:hypothetical protein